MLITIIGLMVDAMLNAICKQPSRGWYGKVCFGSENGGQLVTIYPTEIRKMLMQVTV